MMAQHSGARGSGTISVRRLAGAPEVRRRDVIRAVRCAAGGQPIRSISIVLAGDDTLARLHQQYMNDPTPTDVLTFDLRDEAAREGIEGEVVVSVDTARREAKRRRLPAAQEILRYVIHGMLHLLEYDDATPPGRRRMRAREDAILSELHITAAGRR